MPSPSSLPFPWGRGYLPSLDGWRALSIVQVLGAHCAEVSGFPPSWQTSFIWLFDGNLGVRCFFLISGFLITTLMLRESAERGKLDLKGFYLRRFIRILPVYAVFLFVVALLQQFTSFDQPVQQWLHLLTFTTNFSSVGNWLTGHTWSLACEEQFYFIWPVLFLTCGLGFIRGRILLLLIPILVCPLWRIVTYLQTFAGNNLFLGFSFFYYLDSLAIGCLLAYAHPWLGRNLHRIHISVWIVTCLLLVIIPYVLRKAFVLGIFTVPLGDLCQAVGLSLLISLSVHRPALGAFRFLNLKPVVWIGMISYSLYIWQQIFCTSPATFGWSYSPALQFPWWIASAFVTATISDYMLERPLVNLRKRLHNP